MHNATGITCDVPVADILWIHTRNSVYEFLMIDPDRAFGLVRGGVIGDWPTEAFFCTPTTLNPGTKVRLLLDTAKGMRYITTSPIETITRLRGEGRSPGFGGS